MTPLDPRPTRSFATDGSQTITTATGAVAQAAHVAHSERLERRFTEVRPGVWTLVGNGLSNQSFVDAPDGIIAIDTGESVQEMTSALAELRAVTDRPVVAVLYTHFHYVGGTRAVLAEAPERTIPIHGHERIAMNLVRAGAEIGPTYSRGLVEQFAITLPQEGADANVNVGLGRFFRDPAHAPFTPGHVPVTRPFAGATTLRVAGLDVEVTPAPSDADDSVTYWFPSLGVAVNNLVWPVLFNVFAIRGEEYRDPRVMLSGLDHLLSLHAEHLVGAHGPPLSGADEIRSRVTRYRDSIQYLWDQTVRLTNRGLTGPEVAAAIRLPDHCDLDHLTSEFYGVTEHHVQQIRSGLFGFFDGDEANLFPLSTPDRNARLIDGFGGRDTVRAQAAAALDADDVRWALELGSWLVRSDDATSDDRVLLARALRTVAQRTSAANIRSWCLTRARHLEGVLDMSRFSQHRLQRAQVLAQPLERSVWVLRVLLDPELAAGLDVRVAWQFGDGTASLGPVCGLHLRNSVAVPTDGAAADATVTCTPDVWAALVSGATALSAALAAGEVTVTGDRAAALASLACFEVGGLQS